MSVALRSPPAAAQTASAAAAAAPVFELRDLSVTFDGAQGPAPAVRELSLRLARGSSIGIVGESGSGKTVAMLGALGLLPGARVEGRAFFDGQELLRLPPAQRRALLGRHIGLVFQEPMTALNPVMRIDRQIAEPLVEHGLLSGAAALRRAVELLDLVGIVEPRRSAGCLPHELSGGMRQRVGIAIAIACQPQLLVADEPTTALDATVQLQILRLMARLRSELQMSLVLISHDLGVIGHMCDEVAVLYAGRLVERCRTGTLLTDPQHPYTIGLLGALPRAQAWGEKLYAIEGTVPSPRQHLPGCRFAPRCAAARPRCRQVEPALSDVAPGHAAACLRAPLEQAEAAA